MYTIRAKFKLLYVFLVLFVFLVVGIVVYSSQGQLIKSEKTLESFTELSFLTKLVHVMQQERGLTVKFMSSPNPSNRVDMEQGREETSLCLNEVGNSSSIYMVFDKISRFRSLVDENYLNGSLDINSIVLGYSEIIYEVISAIDTGGLIQFEDGFKAFLQVQNLLIAREHLGRLRAYISVMLAASDINEYNKFYIAERFSFYEFAVQRFLSSLQNDNLTLRDKIVSCDYVNQVRGVVSKILKREQLDIEQGQWFKISSGAIGCYYDVEVELMRDLDKSINFKLKKSKLILYTVLLVSTFFVVFLGFFLLRYLRNLSARIESLDIKMKSVLKTNNYDVHFSDKNEDEIAGISHSLNLLLRFTNNLIAEKDRLASRDRLTGAYNRGKFVEMFLVELDKFKRYGASLCIIMMDIDHFKKINDTFGHGAGDSVLVDITSIIRDNIRTSDVFARWGGEEFVLMAPSCTLASSADLAEKLRQIIEKHVFQNDLCVTMSFGVADVLEGDTMESVMARADSALYESKNSGRNMVTMSKK